MNRLSTAKTVVVTIRPSTIAATNAIIQNLSTTSNVKRYCAPTSITNNVTCKYYYYHDTTHYSNVNYTTVQLSSVRQNQCRLQQQQRSYGRMKLMKMMMMSTTTTPPPPPPSNDSDTNNATTNTNTTANSNANDTMTMKTPPTTTEAAAVTATASSTTAVLPGHEPTASTTSNSNEFSFVTGLSYMDTMNKATSSSSNNTTTTTTSTTKAKKSSYSDSVSTNPIDIANELLDFADRVQQHHEQRTSSSSTTADGKDTKKSNKEITKEIAKKISSTTYESPMQSFFDDMYRNGPTTMGTTTEILEYEKEVGMQEKTLSCGIKSSKLRFSTTSYGRTESAPFVHNNEHRVTCKLHVNDLPFTINSNEYEILQQILGTNRLQNSYVYLSTNTFGSRIENKRHLVHMMDRIISSCQRLASELNTNPNQIENHTGSNNTTTAASSMSNSNTTSNTTSA